MTTPTLASERLLMRPWRPEDRAQFAALNADPRVTATLAGPMTTEASNALADRIATHIETHGWGLWALEIPGKADFIGFAGLSRPSFEAPFTPCVEIGWRLAYEHWGHGYATEAGRVALSFGFTVLDLPEIVSFTTVTNQRSRDVMDRIGLSYDPTADFDHPMLAADHPLLRHVLYRKQKTKPAP
jgi:RimJ/RimL family protein N-acetyltransferase